MIKILNDTGAARGTKILTEAGDDLCEILGVESLRLDFGDANSIIRAFVTLGLVKTETKVRLVEWLVRHPINGKYQAIQSISFVDGTGVSFSEDGGVHSWSRDDNPEIVSTVSINDGRTYKFKAPTDPK